MVDDRYRFVSHNFPDNCYTIAEYIPTILFIWSDQMVKNSGQKERTVRRHVEALNESLRAIPVSERLEENMQTLRKLFEKDETFLLREIQNQHSAEMRFVLAYCGGMVDNALVADNIIKPLSVAKISPREKDLLDAVGKQLLLVHNPAAASNFQEIVEAVTYGDTVLFMPGRGQALIMGTQGFPLRGIEEPSGESVLSGPKEGFCESLIMNLTFIHRRLRTNDLKMEMRTFGVRTRTRACVCYLGGIVKPAILEELFRRLDSIDIDGVLDANYLTEMIRDNPLSPFRSTGYTERPDVVVGKLLEGRIAVFLDGTPVVLTLPYLFVENFQSNEDYYLSFYYTSFSRILRIVGFLVTVLVPAFFLSVVTYHQELLPTPLLLSIANERLNVPFPMWLELLGMLVAFDILRETGVRMPSGVGQAMSVVGALVLGTAAVEAKIVSSLVIIIVALTGITSLSLPKLNAPNIIVRLFLFVFAAFGGLPGLAMGCIILLIHLLRLKSFGQWQISTTGDLRYQRNKDILFRAPLWQMRLRPARLTTEQSRNAGRKSR